MKIIDMGPLFTSMGQHASLACRPGDILKLTDALGVKHEVLIREVCDVSMFAIVSLAGSPTFNVLVGDETLIPALKEMISKL